MKNYLSVISIPHYNGVPADADENTFAWTGPDDPDTAAADINDALHSFYVATNAAGHAIGNYMAPSVSRVVYPTIKVYELTDLSGASGLGTPVAVRPLDATIPGNDSASGLPAELSVCVSFHGDLTGLVEKSGATRPANRHRGRVYVGPLTDGTMVQDGTTHVVGVNSTFRGVCADAAGRMLGGVFGVTWCVWSRKNAALYEVVGGFVDNAFDIQRRRGEDTTARTIWPA